MHGYKCRCAYAYLLAIKESDGSALESLSQNEDLVISGSQYVKGNPRTRRPERGGYTDRKVRVLIEFMMPYSRISFLYKWHTKYGPVRL